MGMDIITDFDKHENDIIEIDDSTYNQDDIKCPYCGYEDPESWEYLSSLDEGEVFEINCAECGKSFNISYDTTIWWQADKIK